MVLPRPRCTCTCSLISHGSGCPLSWGWEQGWELPAALQELCALNTPDPRILTASGDSRHRPHDVPAHCAATSLFTSVSDNELPGTFLIYPCSFSNEKINEREVTLCFSPICGLPVARAEGTEIYIRGPSDLMPATWLHTCLCHSGLEVAQQL